jgi:hypothetical protein
VIRGTKKLETTIHGINQNQNYQAMHGECGETFLLSYEPPIPDHHWACPSNVTDVAATFVSTTL